MEHFSEEFPDDLVVILDGTPPTVARMKKYDTDEVAKRLVERRGMC